MTKSKILNADGSTATKKVPEIKAIHPATSSVLVEMLNPDEVINTNLYVGEGVDTGPPQAYIVEFGHSLLKSMEEGNFPYKVGDRVILTGNYVPVPNWDEHHRLRGLVELHNIKAVIEEK